MKWLGSLKTRRCFNFSKRDSKGGKRIFPFFIMRSVLSLSLVNVAKRRHYLFMTLTLLHGEEFLHYTGDNLLLGFSVADRVDRY